MIAGRKARQAEQEDDHREPDEPERQCGKPAEARYPRVRHVDALLGVELAQVREPRCEKSDGPEGEERSEVDRRLHRSFREEKPVPPFRRPAAQGSAFLLRLSGHGAALTLNVPMGCSWISPVSRFVAIHRRLMTESSIPRSAMRRARNAAKVDCPAVAVGSLRASSWW